MRFTVLSIFILLVQCFGMVDSQDKPVDFSGEWILDADKSEFGEGGEGRRGGRAATKMIVEQEKNLLKVESFRKNRDGEEISIRAEYTLDGVECENEMYNRTSISTAEWSVEDTSLIIQTEMTFWREGQEIVIKIESTWTRKDEGLSIDSKRSSPRGKRESKAVYKKND